MALDAAFLRLRAELTRLRELLRAVRIEARRDCPDRRHCVPGRIHDSGPALSGPLRSAKAAVGLGLTAAGAGGPVPRAMLVRCEAALVRLRRTIRECVGGPARMTDLADLSKRTDLRAAERTAWVARVRPAVLAARRQVRAVSRAAACWRELAAAPAAGVTVMNLAIANQVRADQKPGTDRHRGA